MANSLNLSVHQLVDFLLRSGDIDNRVFNRSTMQEGSRIHASYQKEQDESSYLSEYPLKHSFNINGLDVILEGRADGIIKKKNGDFIIDEIKSTVEDLKAFRDQNIDWHLGQAKCYALMFALERKIDFIDIRLTYIRQGKEKEKMVETHSFATSDLEKYIINLLNDYLSFYAIIDEKRQKRDETIEKINFPFSNYRNGQKQLAKYVYSIAKKGGRFFVEAPTGIGKTMSTLFPFIKAIKGDERAKIFYLTAKTSGKQSAYNAINILKENGLAINDIVVTAKEKICRCPEGACNPDECPFARGYYTKIQNVIRSSLADYSTFDYAAIMKISDENEICPFELELDLSLFCDVIICDYNYLFDPISYMKRYFDEESGSYLALVDEAHNLVDRSRDMYSASLRYNTYWEAKKSLKGVKNSKIKRQFSKLVNLYEDMEMAYPNGETVLDDFPEEFYKVCESFINMYQSESKENSKDIPKEVTTLYLDINRFLKISEISETNHLPYIRKKDRFIDFYLLCLDASSFLSRITNRIKATVFFSATLSPMDYFVDILGGDKAVDASMILPSPFDPKHLKVIVAPNISVKYKNRDASYYDVGCYIRHFISHKVGNYFVYCPSYEYLEHILEYIGNEDIDVYVQTRDMKDQDRLKFLENFQLNPKRTALGVLVIGGAFGEGIDLVSDRLIGAIIIGVGMPKINFESDKIAEYYDNNNLPGHSYAYTNPGMNKVMQAVGRVIRSEDDRGAVLLLDERYSYRQYRELFRKEWSQYQIAMSIEDIDQILTKFYK